ncbi:hypothetical protein F2Q70_00010019 [Brassica cretica]|uniref:Uncharacterized protein n=1 Tax=Brassica cretica TaxID=69181 RepID=A0A8S9LX07_BRACR|nr:hypothetical protein F2Q70_00010019 [Brassica cretica]
MPRRFVTEALGRGHGAVMPRRSEIRVRKPGSGLVLSIPPKRRRVLTMRRRVISEGPRLRPISPIFSSVAQARAAPLTAILLRRRLRRRVLGLFRRSSSFASAAIRSRWRVLFTFWTRQLLGRRWLVWLRATLIRRRLLISKV